MSEELKPCPMPDCGSTLVGTGMLPCGVPTVSCGHCGLSVPETDDATAIERWNSRANEPEPESIPIPTSANMAELMEKVGYRYLQENAPERLIVSPIPASDAELPPLPRPAAEQKPVPEHDFPGVLFFTANQMRAYGKECARAASTRTASEPWGYAMVRAGKVEGLERTLDQAGYWHNAEAVPLGPLARTASDTRTAAGEAECDAARRAAPAGQHHAPTVALHANRWPFVESPGEFTARLQRLLNEGYPLLGAVRNVLIENPPMFAHPEQSSGAVYGIIDPDYGRIYTMVRKLAWEEGYAIGLHGSFTRDLDLIAVPWDDGRRCDPVKLVRRILQATGLKEAHGNPGAKPHGRLVWTLLLPEFGDPRFVDLSIMSVPAGSAREGGNTQPESFAAELGRESIAARTQADAGKADTERLDWLEAHCTGASDSERYLPFRIYWGNKGATKGIRAQIDKARGSGAQIAEGE